jgi:phospholipase C
VTDQPTQGDDNNSHSALDSFDHVVVLMLENRSLDTLLGYLYPQGVPADAPLGKSFDGVLFPDGSAKPLFNPIPGDAVNKPDHGLQIVQVAPVPPGEFNQPYPDPGEEYAYINTQLWNRIDGGPTTAPYNVPPGDPLPEPTMHGFVTDYIRNFKEIESPGMDPDGKGRDPTYDEYAQIMHCYTPEHLPVISTLAREFAVFDHWHCAVPSQTLCNRAFWHAGTSSGLVVNDHLQPDHPERLPAQLADLQRQQPVLLPDATSPRQGAGAVRGGGIISRALRRSRRIARAARCLATAFSNRASSTRTTTCTRHRPPARSMVTAHRVR